MRSTCQHLPNASSVIAFTTVKQNQSPLFKERYLEGGGNRKKSEEEEEEIIEGKEGLVEFGGRERERKLWIPPLPVLRDGHAPSSSSASGSLSPLLLLPYNLIVPLF